ncbi:hypothetical protein SPB21_16670 [Leptothoe sp. ISB3NOV94-8A]
MGRVNRRLGWLAGLLVLAVGTNHPAQAFSDDWFLVLFSSSVIRCFH